MREYKRPLFTQKHYEEMVYRLKHTNMSFTEKVIIQQFLIEVFEEDNYKFDKIKFLNAMGDD